MAKSSEPKTRPTDVPVAEFLATVEPEARRAEAEEIVEIMSAATGAEPVMWGDSIVGWGSMPLHYANGTTLPWPVVGFSPRKAQHTLYLTPGFDGLEEDLARIGPHTLGVSCLYLKRFDRIDRAALGDLVARSWANTLAS